MEYKNITYGTFVSRPNRFIGIVDINGNRETVHIKNTGRCKELLVSGNKVLLEKSDNPARKTAYDLVSVYKNEDLLINMDSFTPNTVVAEWLPGSGIFSSKAVIIREVTYKSSRFDIYVKDGDRKAFIEVKGVTLEDNGHCRFPDAPTERGVKHLNELISCVKDGYEAYVIFVIQFSGALSLSPNDETHKEFGVALRNAEKCGVNILAYDCFVTDTSVNINAHVKVIL